FFSSRRRHTRSKRDWSSDVLFRSVRFRAPCSPSPTPRSSRASWAARSLVAQSDRVKPQQLGEALETPDAVDGHLLGIVSAGDRPQPGLSDPRSAYTYAPKPDA